MGFLGLYWKKLSCMFMWVRSPFVFLKASSACKRPIWMCLITSLYWNNFTAVITGPSGVFMMEPFHEPCQIFQSIPEQFQFYGRLDNQWRTRNSLTTRLHVAWNIKTSRLLWHNNSRGVPQDPPCQAFCSQNRPARNTGKLPAQAKEKERVFIHHHPVNLQYGMGLLWPS